MTTDVGTDLPLIEVRGGVIGYRRALVAPFDLTVRSGEFWAFVGPNGSGKTTLLRTLIGAQRPLAGRIERHPADLRTGYVPQRHHLQRGLPLTAADVAMLGRTPLWRLGSGPNAADRAAVDRALDRTGARELAALPFDSLSGGQQQRVLVARALAAGARVLALDEPTDNVDLAGEAELVKLIAELHREGLTVLLVAHDIGAAVCHADHVCLVDRAHRRITAGPLDEVFDEARLAELYGRQMIIGRGEHGCVHVHVRG
jgi:ABC-type Mn2+/Zn2+ transport system ATPase subunit